MPVSNGASSNPAAEVNTQQSGSSIPYGLEVNVLRFRGRGRDRKSLHLSDRKKTSAASWHKKQFLNSFSKIFCFPNKSFWKWIFRIKICEILYFGFVLKKFVWLLPKYLVILANHKKTTLRSFDYFESTNVEYFKVLKHALKKIIDEIQ